MLQNCSIKKAYLSIKTFFLELLNLDFLPTSFFWDQDYDIVVRHDEYKSVLYLEFVVPLKKVFKNRVG